MNGEVRNRTGGPRIGVIGDPHVDANGALAASAPEKVVRDRPRTNRAAPTVSLELIESIYREHADRFRRVAYGVVRDVHAADDVVQDAFARAVVRRSSFRGRGDVTAWIWRIVVNTAISRQRRATLDRRMLELLRLTREPQSEGADATQLDEQIKQLPARQRAALFLRYYGGLDYAAIAEALSIAPGTVGKLLHDARAALRAALGECDE